MANILPFGFCPLLSQDMVKLPIPLIKSNDGKGIPDSSQRLFFCGDTRGILLTPKKHFLAKFFPLPDPKIEKKAFASFPQILMITQLR